MGKLWPWFGHDPIQMMFTSWLWSLCYSVLPGSAQDAPLQPLAFLSLLLVFCVKFFTVWLFQLRLLVCLSVCLVQERLVKCHGIQCGFCSPGMVMSLYALLRNNPQPSRLQIEQAVQGMTSSVYCLVLSTLYDTHTGHHMFLVLQVSKC